MLTLSFNAKMGDNFLLIQKNKIELPSRLEQVLIIKEKIIITFGSSVISEDIMNSKELLFKHCEDLNHNIWCFDFNGELLWKIPSAYSDKQHQVNIKRDGLPLSVSYQRAYQDPDNENNIIAYTGYMDFVFVEIMTGKLIKQEKRGK
jgi:hypothetical protein